MSRAGLRRVGVLGALLIGGGAMIAGLARPVEPNRTTGGMTLSATATAAASALAAGVDRRLGLQLPAGRTVSRLADTMSGQTVDEVTDLDAAGRPAVITRFDLGGGLVSSVRLGYLPATAAGVLAPVAITNAGRILASVGLAAAGAPAATPRAAGGWLVRWSRLVDGVLVPGDGISVQLSADGSFHALARTEHPLATAPVASIDRARVRTLAGARLHAWLTPDLRGGATIASINLAWVAPNDTFGDLLPSDPAGTLHLAWVVRVTTSGALAERLAGFELAFDAGSGIPLGGDILE